MEQGRILIVDDEPLNRELLEAYLAPLGHVLFEAEDGEDAVRLLESTDVDLVLLDLLMPKLDGIGACRAIRERLGLLDLPVVVVSALGDRAARIRCLEAGADDFLIKPVDQAELVTRVRTSLKLKAYHDSCRDQRGLLSRQLERSQRRLARVERLATLGTLAAGVGHELNNLSAIFATHVHFLRQQTDDGLPAEEEDVEGLELVLAHFTSHARHLMALGNPGHDRTETVQLDELAHETLRMLRASGRMRHVTLETTTPAQPIQVELNANQFQQVLINLVLNAADAVADAEDGRRTVRIELAEEGADVICVVADTGCGIPEESLDAIFDPYFSTKGDRGGTGLGLSVVRHAAEALGGTVTVRSRMGEGSVFRLAFPRSREQRRPEASASRGSSRPGMARPRGGEIA